MVRYNPPYCVKFYAQFIIYMKRFTEKIKNMPRDMFAVFSGHPHGYWGWCVLFFFFLFMFVIVVDISIYLDATRHSDGSEPFDPRAEIDTVNEKALDSILFILSENEKRLQEIQQSPTVSDPSS